MTYTQTLEVAITMDVYFEDQRMKGIKGVVSIVCPRIGEELQIDSDVYLITNVIHRLDKYREPKLIVFAKAYREENE